MFHRKMKIDFRIQSIVIISSALIYFFALRSFAHEHEHEHIHSPLRSLGHQLGRMLEEENGHKHEDGHVHNHGALTRCGVENPSELEMEEINRNIESLRYSKMRSGDNEIVKEGRVIKIHTYVHVIYREDFVGWISRSTIEKQIDILNNAFRGRVSGTSSSYGECKNLFTYGDTVKSPFRFVLDSINYIEDNEAFNLMSDHSWDVRVDEHVGECGDLNIFTGGGMSTLGVSSFPDRCFDDPEEDNILIHYRSFPDMGQAKYDEGDTLVHELGHWLGLFHTFQGQCDGFGDDIPEVGDGVDDTAPEAEPAYDCPVGRDTCAGGGPDPIHNYMDFSDDCCMYRFTQGQIERMVLVAEFFRELFFDDLPDGHETTSEDDPPRPEEPNSPNFPSPTVITNPATPTGPDLFETTEDDDDDFDFNDEDNFNVIDDWGTSFCMKKKLKNVFTKLKLNDILVRIGEND